MALTFDERIADRFERMSPAEQRVVLFFQENREQVLIASAAALAAKAETSDATIVRATKALGFSGLEDLRQTLANELRSSLSPAERLTRTLGEVGTSLAAAFEMTLEIHLQSLESLRRTITPEQFEKAVGSIVGAQRILVFGIGPSSAMAAYLVIQLARFGLDAASLTNTGLLFADDLQKLRKGDLVIILAYGRVYAELAVLLDEIDRRGVGSLLLTDTLAAKLRHRVDLVLPVARGRADMLSMHTATLGLIETLLVGVATQRTTDTLASLNELNETRKRLAGKAMSLPVPNGDR
ncbi:putative HTH-type transcriptional regulator YbbH [Aminobacter sp. MSH1]|uniref:MurR/RpiR family transcriptional regulator n=1 Tax=Aminobacter sp. MSH1 TaxID=374606 RepID=UPI000D343DEA|nr:MurR/RpiR family transcriptional regulator [Aminobacter sp. MSH1]AWC25215.1 putative HTH-type transcriptional regulator YbbH [Aminobacter sp. MSH1]